MSLRNLRPGTRFAMEAEPLGDGRFRVVARVRVGATAKDLGPAKIVRGEAEVHIEMERWHQEALARLGLAETER
jgi:hypothetical protein